MEQLLKVAGDQTRLKILFCLLDELDCSIKNNNLLPEKCVNDISNQIGASQSLVSHQLKVLKDSNFVDSRKEGNKVYYFLKDGHIKDLLRIATDHVMEDE